jgi:hypothetical protein
MTDAARAPGDAPPLLAATVVEEKLRGAKPARRPARRPAQAPGGPRGGGSWLLAVVGFVVVLVVGGLLLFFLLRSI